MINLLEYSTIQVSVDQHKVGHIKLNRPKKLNALNFETMEEVCSAAQCLDRDDDVAVIVISGDGKSFAAGADISEMADLSFSEAYMQDLFTGWDSLASIRKPIIGSVAGYALGGGCELAMMCDIVIAGDGAKFGQPEISLGIIPGMGGTQRLTRAVGKAKAMDLILSGRMISAVEAESYGLVSRVVPDDLLADEVSALARDIAGKSKLATKMAKESVNVAFEGSLTEGLRFERRAVQALFSTEDQKEGMAAFLNKRKPAFIDR